MCNLCPPLLLDTVSAIWMVTMVPTSGFLNGMPRLNSVRLSFTASTGKGFIAGSTNITLRIQPFNCQNWDGLQAGIFSTPDCNNFLQVSNCDMAFL